jgi:hypothetical protein
MMEISHPSGFVHFVGLSRRATKHVAWSVARRLNQPKSGADLISLLCPLVKAQISRRFGKSPQQHADHEAQRHRPQHDRYRQRMFPDLRYQGQSRGSRREHTDYSHAECARTCHKQFHNLSSKYLEALVLAGSIRLAEICAEDLHSVHCREVHQFQCHALRFRLLVNLDHSGLQVILTDASPAPLNS